jgi:hypothetical protein
VTFTLAFDRRQKILLARVGGVLSSGDMTALDDAVLRFTARHGPTHGVMDFTSVSTVAVPIAKLLQHGQQLSDGCGYKRVVAMSNGELRTLARTAAREPVIVSSIDEALRQLGATDPSFESVDPI